MKSLHREIAYDAPYWSFDYYDHLLTDDLNRSLYGSLAIAVAEALRKSL